MTQMASGYGPSVQVAEQRLLGTKKGRETKGIVGEVFEGEFLCTGHEWYCKVKMKDLKELQIISVPNDPAVFKTAKVQRVKVIRPCSQDGFWRGEIVHS